MKELDRPNMNRAAALAWREDVGTQGQRLKILLDTGFQKRAWVALGYLTWGDCLADISTMFDLSLGHMKRLDNANQIQHIINDTNISPRADISTTIPERQLRPLTGLSPDRQREAWQIANDTAPDGKVTAAHVAHTVRQMSPDGQRGINYHDGKLKNTIATCQVCNQLYDGEALSYCPYCAYTQEQRMAYVTDQQERPKMLSSSGKNLDAMMTSNSEEWYTTPDIINLALEAMVHIDLDPCSNSHEDPNVPAAHHFTKEDDGLSREWFGRVYMNPPYGNAIPHWIEKVVSEYKAGRVEQAIILVPARTDTRWFRMLEEYPRCFMWGRVRFNDHKNSAPFPTMLVALGIDIEQFKFVTKETGTVYAVV